jgi:hypothetical protein
VATYEMESAVATDSEFITSFIATFTGTAIRLDWTCKADPDQTRILRAVNDGPFQSIYTVSDIRTSDRSYLWKPSVAVGGIMTNTTYRFRIQMDKL